MSDLKLSDSCMKELSLYVRQVGKVESAVDLVNYCMIDEDDEDEWLYTTEQSRTACEKSRLAAIEALEDYIRTLKCGIGELVVSTGWFE